MLNKHQKEQRDEESKLKRIEAEWEIDNTSQEASQNQYCKCNQGRRRGGKVKQVKSKKKKSSGFIPNVWLTFQKPESITKRTKPRLFLFQPQSSRKGRRAVDGDNSISRFKLKSNILMVCNLKKRGGKQYRMDTVLLRQEV